MRYPPFLAPILLPVALAAVAALAQAPPGGLLQQQLAREGVDNLARAARQFGDPSRGATVFYRPQLTCTKCHAGEGPGVLLGPDLAKAGKAATDTYLVESLLTPSKQIKNGFQTVTIVTQAGKSVTGLLAEETAERVVLRDPAQDGKPVTIAKGDIAERNDKGPSIMPDGLVNLLADRQEFLDLARYLMEIAEKGTDRANELRPPPSLFAPPTLPAYERNIDHAGLIAALNEQSLKQGEATYVRVCASCHGTRDAVGSLPTAPRFASSGLGQFKNGSDPYRMYQTLTHGVGLMVPQSWMVPQQKHEVIHYIRETFLKPHNPGHYARVDEAYLSGLPKGTERGPKPSDVQPWVGMNYGPNMMTTLQVGDGNIARKAIAVRLDAGPGGVSRGRHWLAYDHDTLRAAAGWSGDGFIDWNWISFNGRHEVHPKAVGRVGFANPVGPGWADPETGRFDDPRPRGRDNQPYGPLPRRRAHYQGTYHFNDQVIVSYTVGRARVLETPGYEPIAGGPGEATPEKVAFTRTLDVGASPHDLTLRVAPRGPAVALVGGKASLAEQDGFTLLRIPAAATPLTVKVLVAECEPAALAAHAKASPPAMALAPLTKGGPRRWPEILKTQTLRGADVEGFAVDALTHPAANPWQCQMRLSGLDFLTDGRQAAVCSWDGDVWLVGGIDDPAGGLTWQRIASGLYHPLGVKLRDGRIYVCCRDQLVALHDLNGDGETDFYENFNNDHQATEHFHEFATGLQTDAEGNFYYAKAAKPNAPAVVPQHGTLLRVSKDGSRTDILATGFRAPNGVCLNPDGTFFLTDQQGHWTPNNRMNWITEGGYYGYAWGYHDVTDTSDAAMKQPAAWFTNNFDRSPSEPLWVDSAAWGPLKGSLLSVSYGYGKIYVVPHEKVNGTMQGGVCELPIARFPTGLLRGRFHPGDGQLYICGMYAWAGSQTQPGGLYRVRYTGKAVHVPVGLSARRGGMAITFSAPLDPRSATDPKNYAVRTWSLKRSAQYGSKPQDEKPSTVTGATLSADGKTVHLTIADMKPVQSMEIKYNVRGPDGKAVNGLIENTIHHLRD